MSEGSNGAVRAMSDAVLAIARERSVDTVLQRIVHSARELVSARYAALGVPDGQGNFARFITSGMTEEEIAEIAAKLRTQAGMPKEPSGEVNVPASGKGVVDKVKDAVS